MTSNSLFANGLYSWPCAIMVSSSFHLLNINDRRMQRYLIHLSFIYLFVDGRFCEKKQNLVAVISGGAEVVRGLNENITMNGSLSYDPETGDNKGMNFTWRYGSIPRNNNTSLQLVKQGSFSPVNVSAIQNEMVSFGRIISINTNATNGSETFVITLTVAKDYRTAIAIQVVHLVKGDPPRIYQRYETLHFICISTTILISH